MGNHIVLCANREVKKTTAGFPRYSLGLRSENFPLIDNLSYTLDNGEH